MTQILNSLIVSEGKGTQNALEMVMSNNIEGHVLRFSTYSPEHLHEVDREPDLIFIDNSICSATEDIQRILTKFPHKTCVVLDENPEENRLQFLKAGADEVMSLSELHSVIGKHLLEKLLAFKDRAAAEFRIEQSEERFRGIIEHSHDIIMLLDAEGTVVYTSPAFGRLLNYESWEILGQTFFDFVHDDDRIALEHHFRKLARGEGKEGAPFEFQFRKNDGEWRIFDTNATNLLENQTVQSIVFNIRDVTEEKQTEIELEKYRQHLEDLVEKRTREVEEANRKADSVVAASPDALIAIDDEGYILFVSQHYRNMYPKSAYMFTPGEHIMQAFDTVTQEIGLDHNDPRYQEMHDWWSAPKGAKEFEMRDGLWLRLLAKRMQGQAGIVISTTNITDYKRQQALLAQQSAELSMALEKEKHIVEQQKTFISMVSHEFRTPLTIIDGNAQIIQRRGASLTQEILEKRAGTIRSGVERLIQLIETILSSYALESGRLSVNLQACNIETIIREIIAEQQSISQYHTINIDLRRLPPQMNLDEKMIRHMLANLLSNAVKYAPGNPEIDVISFSENGKVVIEVQDHGVGIPENELPKIFSKYFRASTSGGIPGSGLGLSLVKQFVELHNGTVDLRSKLGVGTVITVSLPIE